MKRYIPIILLITSLAVGSIYIFVDVAKIQTRIFKRKRKRQHKKWRLRKFL